MSSPTPVNPSSGASSSERSLPLLLATVLLPFALAHFVSYLYRTVNAIVYADLSHDMMLTAGSLGLLTGAYFIAFAAAQLPVGVALDRFGPRKVQVPLLLVAAIGAYAFSHAQSLQQLVVARALIGLGVAGSLMAAIKACSLWLPPARLPMATSVLLAVGGLGAMASTTPLQVALAHTDWRGVFLGLAASTVVIGVLILMVVPEHPKRQHTHLADMARAVGQLYSSWSFWRLALYSVLSHATYMAVLGLWMGPWLRDVAGLRPFEVSQVLMAGTIAMVAGSLAFGWLIDRLRRRGIQPMLICGGGIVVFVVFQAMMVFPPGLSPLWIAIGFSFFGTSTTMNYAIIAESVPPHLTGRVTTSFNLLVFLLAFVVQWGIGSVLGLWAPVQGAYPLHAYQVALGVNLLLQLPGLLLWVRLKPWQLSGAGKSA